MLSTYFLNNSEIEKITNLKNLWAKFVLEKKSILPKDVLFLAKDPFFASHPIAWAILNLWGAYYSLELPKKTWDVGSLNLSERCELALLEKMAGVECSESMESTRGCLEFPALFLEEKKYALDKDSPIFSLFFKAMGFEKPSLQSHFPSLYLKALDVFLPCIETDSLQESSWLSAHSSQGVLYAYTKRGKNVGIGALKSSKFSIPTFGFSAASVSGEDLFGVTYSETTSPFGYISALKDVWFQLLNFENRSGFDIRIFGLQPGTLVHFCFFIIADTALILDEVLQKQTLQTFKKSADEIKFLKDDEIFTIKNIGNLKVEVIPLACDASYWGSSFLARFQVPSGIERISFEFSLEARNA